MRADEGSVDRANQMSPAMKALAKVIAERYESAAAFGADLRAWQRDEPISARPPSTLYRLKKFTRRHRVLVTAAASVGAGRPPGACRGGGVWLHRARRPAPPDLGAAPIRPLSSSASRGR